MVETQNEWNGVTVRPHSYNIVFVRKGRRVMIIIMAVKQFFPGLSALISKSEVVEWDRLSLVSFKRLRCSISYVIHNSF